MANENKKNTINEELDALVEAMGEASDADMAWFWDDEEEDAAWNDMAKAQIKK